ncbi:MAG: type 4a pilus biogenesis protein PilO [bacterium]
MSPGRKQVLLVVLVTAIVVAVLLALVINPQLTQVRIARQRALRLEQERTRTAGLVDTQPQIEQRFLAARRGIQNLLVRVPVGPQLPELIAYLDDAVVISGVQLAQISFATAEQTEAANQVPAGIGTTGLAIQVQGSYPQVRRFVTAIETSPRAMAIDRLALTASDSRVLADLAVRAFHLR